MEKVNKDNSIGTQIGRTFRVLRSTLQKHFESAGYNLTLEQWLILMLLKIKDARNQHELTEACDKEKTTVTRLIDNLHKQGLVERVQDPKNRRSNIIYITKKGLEVENKLTPIAININRKALKGISKDEVELLLKLLNKMVDNLSDEN